MIVKKRFEIIPILILVTIVFSSCTKTAEPEAAKNVNINQSPTVLNSNSVSNSSVALDNNAAPVNSPNYAASNVNNINTEVAGKGDKKKFPVEKVPTPQIGSGGGDLSLFTQVRGALGSDEELMKAVIVEIKEGNATLSGNVSSEAQKTKAGQLVQNVNGIRSIKNNLRVSP